MKIVIDKDVVWELTDDGEIITDDIPLKKLAASIKHRTLSDLISKKGNKGHYFYIAKVKKSDPNYYTAVAEILLDNGYGLRE